MLIFPLARRWIASLQGCATHSQADRIVTARYSAFLFITQFFIFSVLGVAVQIGTLSSPRFAELPSALIFFLFCYDSHEALCRDRWQGRCF